MLRNNKFSIKNLFYNIPFLFSALAANTLVCLSTLSVEGFVLVSLSLTVTCCFYKFDFSFLKGKLDIFKGVISFSITAYTAYCFYSAFIKFGSLFKLSKLLNIKAETLLLSVTISLAIISIYSFYYFFCLILYKFNLISELKNIYIELNTYKNFKLSFVTIFLIYLISNITIIRSNYDYMDDMRRKMFGEGEWGFGRTVSNFLSCIIHADSYLADISPLTTIFAVLFLSLASVILITKFSKNKKITTWNIIAVIPLGVSPLFIECMSYKYDCPYMALSILTMVAPLLFISKRKALYLESILLSTVITCSCYQASLGIFPVTIILFSLLKWLNGEKTKEILLLISTSSIGYILGILIFKLCLLNKVNYGYAPTDILPLNKLAHGFLDNIKDLVSFIYHSFDVKWLFLIMILSVSFIFLTVVSSKRNKLCSAIFVILGLILSFALCVGVYIVLEYLYVANRSMYGFTSLIAILALICTTYKLSDIAKLSSLCLSWCFIAFSFAYGNALAEQQRYEDFRINMVLNKLDEIIQSKDESNFNIEIVGSCGYSPAVENNPNFNGVLGNLIQHTFEGGTWVWSSYYFYNYFDLHNYTVVENLENKNLPIVSDNYYQTIRSDGKNILIELKDIVENSKSSTIS